MKKNINAPKFLWLVASAHTIAYFIVWRCALAIHGFSRHRSPGALPDLMLTADAPAMALGSILQVFYGLLLALAIFPLRKTVFEEKHGLLKLGLLVIGLSEILAVRLGMGWFEGYVYAQVPLMSRILRHVEAVVYTALFIGMLALAKRYYRKIFATVLSIAAVSLRQKLVTGARPKLIHVFLDTMDCFRFIDVFGIRTMLS